LLLSGPNPFPGASPLKAPWVVHGGLWYRYESSAEPAWASSHCVCKGFTVVQLSEERRAIALRPQEKVEGMLEAIVNPGLGTSEVGVLAGSDKNAKRGIEVKISRTGNTWTFSVRSIQGDRILWRKVGLGLVPYAGYLLRVQTTGKQVQAELFDGTGSRSLAVSPKLQAPAWAEKPYWGLIASGGPGRFRCARWEKGTGPNAAGALDLRLGGGTEKIRWHVAGSGSWQWSDKEHNFLKQLSTVPRTAAVQLVKQPLRGTWRTTLRILPGGRAAGMAVHTDGEGRGGVGLYLGGTWGNGSLVLSSGGKVMWSSPEGKWRYNDTYVLELDIQRGFAQGRLLTEGEERIIAESPGVPVRGLKPGYFALFSLQSRCLFSDFGALDSKR